MWYWRHHPLLDNDQLDDIEGEVAKRSRPVSSLSGGHDPGFGHAVQPTPFSSQMKPWLNISMDSIVIETV
jgi:hypothetical protein